MTHSEKRAIAHPDRKIFTGAYSSAVLLDGWAYVSGQGPIDMTTGQVVPGSIEEQTILTLKHVEAILAQASATLNDVVKCTCYLASIADFDRFNAAYGSMFPGVRPARTTIQSTLWGGMLIEIDAVARVRSLP